MSPPAGDWLRGVADGAVPAAHRIGYGGAFRVDGVPGHAGSLTDRSRVRAILHEAVSRGATLLDTADSYGPALSEEILADTLYPYPAGLLIATKGGVQRLGPAATRLDARPAALRAACDASLRRLRLDSIELYQLHWRDPGVPFADQLGALADLQSAGKIRHIGLCNVTGQELQQAVAQIRVAAVQNRCGLADIAGASLADRCRHLGIAFIAHSTLAVLKYTGSGPLDVIAARHGATRAQVALAWVLERAANAIVIPGTLCPAHLAENMAAGALRLQPDDMTCLERPFLNGAMLGGAAPAGPTPDAATPDAAMPDAAIADAATLHGVRLATGLLS